MTSFRIHLHTTKCLIISRIFDSLLRIEKMYRCVDMQKVLWPKLLVAVARLSAVFVAVVAATVPAGEWQ